jgi:saccharopine dehydrogenase-like NADP-dependent oxidoreductase
MNIAVLGAGMVGRVMALDLASSHHITSIDLKEENLSWIKSKNKEIDTIQADLMCFENYQTLLAPYDMIVLAVPGFMGYRALEAVILAGKHTVDISFFPEDALQLDGLAKDKGVTIITDCGVAPGMSNYLIGYYNKQIDIDALEIYVGGLPLIRKKPFEYKAPFSPIDVIEEYTRPARLFENGRVVIKPALSEREWMHFDEVGTLEAFNTDGLRSLLFTMPHIRNQKEKTLRYPGHIDLVVSLKEAGFFNDEPIELQQYEIKPIDFTSKILFKEWKLKEDEPELTIMKVILHGNKEGKPVTVTGNLLDYFDAETGYSSMSRTTGFTATATVNMMAAGLFQKKGVFPPELVGDEPGVFDFILHYLNERKVNWHIAVH